MAIINKWVNKYVKIKKRKLNIHSKISLNEELKKYKESGLLKVIVEHFKKSSKKNYQPVRVPLLKQGRLLEKHLKSIIKDPNITKFYLNDLYCIAKYTITLNELGIRFDKRSGNYKLYGINLELPIIHGILETYLTLMDKELKHAYKSNLLDALKSPDLKKNVVLEDKPYNTLKKIIERIKLYNKIVKGESSIKKTAFVQLEDTIEYAIYNANVLGRHSDGIINFKKDLAYVEQTQ